MTESEATAKQNELIEAPQGWKRVDGLGDPANVFEIDPNRPDFPEKWRSRAVLRERERLARDPLVRGEINQLRREFGGKERLARITEFVVRGSEIRESVGNNEISTQAGMLLDHFRVKIREAAERCIPEDVSYVTALRYISEETLPVELVFYVYDELPTPLKLIVNMEERKRVLVSLMPGEALIRFRGIVRRDLNRIGHFITEAIALQSPDRSTCGTGGRRAIDEDPDNIATAELVARLFHWEGWSQRRIAAFLGWLKPTDEWDDPKTRARVEQRVRRWLRIGENELKKNAADDSWKQRSAQLDAARQAEGRKKGRR